MGSGRRVVGGGREAAKAMAMPAPPDEPASNCHGDAAHFQHRVGLNGDGSIDSGAPDGRYAGLSGRIDCKIPTPSTWNARRITGDKCSSSVAEMPSIMSDNESSVVINRSSFLTRLQEANKSVANPKKNKVNSQEEEEIDKMRERDRETDGENKKCVNIDCCC